MVTTQFYDFATWFPAAVVYFFELGAALAASGLLICYLVTAFRYGPLAAGDIVFRVTTTALVELGRTSPRRVWALARLAIQESIRRHVLVALAVFLIILMFAGWFLDNTSNDPSALYMTFVLTSTTYLAWALGVFLSAFSLPTDFKNRTIYTVVTKPVRSGEIVLGRILGFTLIGTVILAIMGMVSYFFAIRLLNHTHEIDVASLQTTGEGDKAEITGRTSLAHGHRHQVVLRSDGTGSTDLKNSHWHDVASQTRGDKTTYSVSNPEGIFLARVPVWGSLRFKDRSGTGMDRGISVGKEWTYRSFVEGGTAGAGIWTFHGITPKRFPNGLPIEMTIRVFRSYKGDINRGILAGLVVKNPKTGKASNVLTFQAKDATIDRHDIPVELTDSEGQALNLFKDLAPEGDVEIWVQCLDPAQYFGMAMPDLYLRASDASFAMNFVKGYFGIWLQMLLVISFSVMFSTFLSGPVAMLATVAVLVMGMFTQFIGSLFTGGTQGGGPIESAIRIVKQQNVTIDIEPGLTTTVVKAVDWFLLFVMDGLAHLLPDLSTFDESFVTPVAKGFDISPDAVAVWAVRGLAYLCVVFVVGYFFLKTREVAR
jgi:ABC-type transport system involved in multi-copper enzyme maturation permease subunit